VTHMQTCKKQLNELETIENKTKVKNFNEKCG